MIKAIIDRVREALFPLPDDFDETILENYEWANTRFPQGGTGLLVKFADTALMQRNFDPIQLAGRHLTSDELTRLGDTMDKAHAAYGVAVATERGKEKVRLAVAKKRQKDPDDIRMGIVSDEDLSALWLGFRNASLMWIALLAGVDPKSDTWPALSMQKEIPHDAGLDLFPIENLRRFAKLMRDPSTLGRVRAMMNSFRQTLESDEGKALGAKIRNAASEVAATSVEDTKQRQKKRAEMGAYHDKLGELCLSQWKERRKPSVAEKKLVDDVFKKMDELIEPAPPEKSL